MLPGPGFASSAAGRRVLTVSFNNLKSQNLKLSVSDPKNKYVACVSALSQISICQSLGRKNKHETLKTDRSLLRPLACYPARSSYNDDNDDDDNDDNNKHNNT